MPVLPLSYAIGHQKIKPQKGEQKQMYCPFYSCLKLFTETGNLKTHLRTHVTIVTQIILIDGREALPVHIRGMPEAIHNKGPPEDPWVDSLRRQALRMRQVRQVLLPLGQTQDSLEKPCNLFIMRFLDGGETFSMPLKRLLENIHWEGKLKSSCQNSLGGWEREWELFTGFQLW